MQQLKLGLGERHILALNANRLLVQVHNDALVRQHLWLALLYIVGGRDYNTVDLGRYHLFNEYMQPYKACVDAGVGSVMASFNSLDGMPSTCNPYLLTEVLRNQWGFTGFTMSDYNAVQELMSHCATGDLMTSAILSLKAGLIHSELVISHEHGAYRTIGVICSIEDTILTRSL